MAPARGAESLRFHPFELDDGGDTVWAARPACRGGRLLQACTRRFAFASDEMPLTEIERRLAAIGRRNGFDGRLKRSTSEKKLDHGMLVLPPRHLCRQLGIAIFASALPREIAKQHCVERQDSVRSQLDRPIKIRR